MMGRDRRTLRTEDPPKTWTGFWHTGAPSQPPPARPPGGRPRSAPCLVLSAAQLRLPGGVSSARFRSTGSSFSVPVGGRHARRSRRAAHELPTSPTVGLAACAWLERRSALQSGWLGRNGVQRGRRGGLRCRCPSVSAAPPILCLRPVVSCLHPSHLLCMASGTRPDASPPPYARSFWPMPASENTPLLPQLDRVLPPFPSALAPTPCAGRALLLALCACPHQAAGANCEAGGNCDAAASWREDDELLRLSTSPEVLEAVSEDFGGDERVLAEGGGGCVPLPAPLVSPRSCEPACVVRVGCGRALGASAFRDQPPRGSSAAQFVLVAPDVLRLHDPVVLEHAGHRAVHSATASPE